MNVIFQMEQDAADGMAMTSSVDLFGLYADW